MFRTQIQLTEEQSQRLRRIAVDRGVSVARLVREAVDRMLEDGDSDAKWERALAVVGKYHGDAANVSEEHDRYLADAFAE